MVDLGMLYDMIESASSMLGSLFYAMTVERLTGSGSASIFTTIAAVCVLLGAFFCFLGYRFRRIVGAFAWAVVGLFIGGIFITNQLVVGLIIAVAAGALCFRFQKAGAFLFCFLSAALLFFLLALSPFDFLNGFSLSVFTPTLLVGLVYAIAAMKWERPLMILATAAFGGVSAGLGIALLMNVTSFGTCQTIMVVAAAAGAILQWVQSKPKAAAAPAQPIQQPVQPIQTAQSAQPQAPAEANPDQAGAQGTAGSLFEDQEK